MIIQNELPKQEQLLHLYKAIGWQSYLNDISMTMQAVQNSLFFASYYIDEKLVGFARVVGDGLTIIYIQDLIVLPEYQNQGIGSSLLKLILDTYSEVLHTILIADNNEELSAFYRAYQFKELSEYKIKGFGLIK